MYATRLFRVLGSIVVLGLTLAVFATPAAAQTVYNWDATVTGGPHDGTGNWSLTGSNWWTGTSDILWPNTTSSAAQFGTGSGGTTAYSVALDPAGVTAGGVIFQNQAYTLTGTSTLTLGGATPTVTVNASVGTIATPIGGSGGLTTAGNGTLILTNAETYSGPTVISGGKVTIGTVPPVVTGTPTTTGVYTFTPASNNLLLGLSPIANTNTQGGNASNHSPTGPVTNLTDGTISNTNVETTDMPFVYTIGSGAQLTYSLGSAPLGYNLSQLNIYSEWPDGGRSQITLNDISYSTVANPTVFTALPSSNFNTATGQREYAAHLTAANGVLASGVSEVRFDFGGQQNGWVGYAELEAVGTPVIGNALPASSALSIAATSTLDLGGASQQVASLGDFSPGSGGTIINSNTNSTSLLTLSPIGGSTVFSGVISGGGTLGTIGLVMNGSGTQVLAGNNTFTGGTTITAGTLNLANANALKNSTVSVNAANGLVFSPGVGTYNVGGLSGTNSVALNDTSSLPVTLSAGGNNATSVYTGVMSGPGSFIKTGSGTLFLGTSSSYTGSTIIAGGTLKLPAPAGTVGATTGVVSASPGTPAGPLSLISRLTPSSNTNPLPGQGGNFGPTGPVSVLTDGINNMNHSAAAEATWYSIGNNTSLTYTLPASSQGFNISNINLFSNWDDQGRSQITVSNISYSTVSSPAVFIPIGNTAVNSNPGSSNEVSFSASGGVMATNVYAIQINFGPQNNSWTGYGEMEVLGNAVAAGSNFLPTTTALQLGAASGNATLDLSGANQQVASLSDYNGFTNGVVVSNGGPSTLTLSSTGGSTVFSGVIQGGGSTGAISLAMSGSGTQVLAGANTYNGGTTIGNGSTLQLGTSSWGGYDGSIASTSGVTNNGALDYNLFGSQTLSSYAISGSGSLTKLGPGSLTIATSNSYTGSTTIGAGTLQIGTGGTGGAIGSTGSVLDNGALVFNRSDNYGGNFGPVISGTGSLNVAGGTLNLAGINTYSGATSVNSGMLVLSAGTTNVGSSLINVSSAGTLNVSSFGGGSGIALTSGQTLRGSGTVVGPVAVSSGATVQSGTGAATGTGIGTLTLANNLNLATRAQLWPTTWARPAAELPAWAPQV